MKKKVLFLTNSYSGGGAENAVNLMLQYLKPANLQVSLMTINKNFVEIDSKKFPFRLIELNRQKDKKITLFKAYIKFIIYVSLEKPNIIVAHCELPEIFASLVFGKIKTVICVHTTKPYTGHIILGKIIRFIHRTKKSYWVRISDNLKIDKINEDNLVTIENPIDYKNLNSSKLNRKHNTLKRLVFIGRISKIAKRPDLAIEIAHTLNSELVLIGDGDWKEELQSLNAKNMNIRFFGYQHNPWRFIKKGDLVLVTSDWEGEPLLLFEAYLNQVPILMRDIPELTKFNFPPRFYCKDTKDFIKTIKIIQTKKNLSDYIINSKKLKINIINKNPVKIATSWEKYLVNL